MPGRNDACPCGSGKKYKKCCIPKYDKPVAAPAPLSLASLEKQLVKQLKPKDWWQPEAVGRMPDDEIVSTLSQMGITAHREGFLQDLQDQLSSDRVAQLWQERRGAPIDGKDAIFPMLAARQLSKRWAPDLFSFDKLESMVDRLDDYGTPQQDQERLELLRAIWDRLKLGFLVPLGIRSWEELHERFDSSTDFGWVLEDYTLALRNAAVGLKMEQRMPLMEERIALCRELPKLLPDIEPSQLLNLRMEIGESHALMGDFSQADVDFEKITADSPDSVWAYIQWGDLYSDSDRAKAESIYRLGLDRCQGKPENEQDLEDLEERLVLLSQQ